MTYIYDVILNFTELRVLEFFEWKENDKIENIKKIPIFRISSEQLYDLINYHIKIEHEFLEKIKNETTTYKNKLYLEYSSLFTDLNRVVGIQFTKDGNIISRSSLLIDEEEDIIIECHTDEEIKLQYERKQKIESNKFYTREEQKRRKYILEELEIIYRNNEKDKLNYLYKEIYPNKKMSFQNKYQTLKREIENNYSSKYNILYEILKLSCTKK